MKTQKFSWVISKLYPVSYVTVELHIYTGRPSQHDLVIKITERYNILFSKILKALAVPAIAGVVAIAVADLYRPVPLQGSGPEITNLDLAPAISLSIRY